MKLVSNRSKFSQNIDTITPSIWSPNKSYGLIEKPIEEKIVFRNATIWTNSTLGIIENSDVAIYKGKILAVGKSLRIKDVFKSDTTGIKIIDAKEPVEKLEMKKTMTFGGEHSKVLAD